MKLEGLKDKILKQKGKYLIIYTDKIWNGKRYVLDKMVLDLDNMLYDSYDWYKLNEMQNEASLDKIDDYLKGAISIRKIK